jgi:hypothetical protein
LTLAYLATPASTEKKSFQITVYDIYLSEFGCMHLTYKM